ncbi:MAG: hypothetical protein H0W11_05450 [Gemmatimonadetes bacterium]|nr:hypothetical protein [Gemmatimonadota bacterium]
MRTLLRFLVSRPLLAAAGLTLLLPLPAPAQHSRHQVRWVHNDRSVQVEVNGEVEFSETDTEVVRLSPGGRFMLEERRPDRPTHRIEYTSTGSDLRETFSVEGRPRALDAEGRAWLAALLPEVVRETAIGAEGRITRILARRGVVGVIEEIERIRSDSARRIYYRHLLARHELDARAQARALRSAGQRIGSDGDKSSLLREVGRSLNLEDAQLRGAYFEAVGTISSDGDHASVLRALLDRAAASDAFFTTWLASAQTISSDGDKASLLTRAAVRTDRLQSESVRRAFFGAAGTIRSDGDRQRVLTAVLRAEPATSPVAIEAMRNAAGIHSDGDKAAVLLAVPPRLLPDPAVRRAYEETARSIASDGDRARVLNHLTRYAKGLEVRRGSR